MRFSDDDFSFSFGDVRLMFGKKKAAAATAAPPFARLRSSFLNIPVRHFPLHFGRRHRAVSDDWRSIGN